MQCAIERDAVCYHMQKAVASEKLIRGELNDITCCKSQYPTLSSHIRVPGGRFMSQSCKI